MVTEMTRKINQSTFSNCLKIKKANLSLKIKY